MVLPWTDDLEAIPGGLSTAWVKVFTTCMQMQPSGDIVQRFGETCRRWLFTYLQNRDSSGILRVALGSNSQVIAESVKPLAMELYVPPPGCTVMRMVPLPVLMPAAMPEPCTELWGTCHRCMTS